MSEETRNLLSYECYDDDVEKSNNTDHVVDVESKTKVDPQSTVYERICGSQSPSSAAPSECHPVCSRKLEDGKEAHLFVSYCNEDRWRVWPIVETLEKEHRAICLFDERDFQPGMQIHENIARAMEKTMKVLVFLSENFLKSNYCNHEKDLAFLLSMETGEQKVIPVLLEECEIPSTIKPLTYIDATSYDADVCAKIVETLNNREPSGVIDAGRYKRSLENGFYIDLFTEEPAPCLSRPVYEEVVLADYTKQHIQAAKFKVPIASFQRAVDIVNRFRMRKRWGRYPMRLRTLFCCCSTIIFWITIPMLYYLSVLLFYTRTVSTKSLDIEYIWNPYIFMCASISAPFVISGLVFGYFKFRQSRDLNALKNEIFDGITAETYKQGALFEIMVRQTTCNHFITLRVTRYNLQPCLKFLAKQIQDIVEKQHNVPTETTEIFDTFADDIIIKYLGMLMEVPPTDAPVTRHPVKGGKECFCQRLEPLLTERFLRSLGVFENLSILSNEVSA